MTTIQAGDRFRCLNTGQVWITTVPSERGWSVECPGLYGWVQRDWHYTDTLLDAGEYERLPRPGEPYRHYAAPWGVRHVARWALNALAWTFGRKKYRSYVRGIEATTPGPFTVWWVTDPSENAIAEEEAHQRQCAELGWWRYAWAWFAQLFAYGYGGGKLEKEADKAGEK